MNGKFMAYISQYGDVFYASTLRELREKVSGEVSKMYHDKADGQSVHIGYVIGQLWLTAYEPVERPA